MTLSDTVLSLLGMEFGMHNKSEIQSSLLAPNVYEMVTVRSP